MGRINREVLVRTAVLLLLTALLTYALTADKLKYYVHPRLEKYIWFSVGGLLVIELALLPELFRPKHKVRLLPCLILFIPAATGLLIPATSAGTASMQAGTASVEPFHVTASDFINVSDEDYMRWYTDAFQNPQKYDNKTVRIKGVVFRMEGFAGNEFVPARMSMTCCAADLAAYGFICRYGAAGGLKTDEWVYVTAKVKAKYEPRMKRVMPVLYAVSVTKAPKPQQELVYPF
ncbi:MAG TPA: TIGR03943 family protein [Ruminiclostridium sp.]|nr:TIGR03943 family protein [Ruminiclostridium sp.]